jgi:hypothetical protein
MVAVLGALVLLRTPRSEGQRVVAPPSVVPTESSALAEAIPRALAVPGREVAPVERLDTAHSSGTELLLPGGWLRGRLTSPERSTWGGYHVGLASADEGGSSEELRERADRAWESLRPVKLDGRFELGPFPEGLATLYLYMPVELVWRAVGEGNWNRQALAQVELVNGRAVEREFEVSALPGQLVVDVRVNGEPRAGLEVEVRRDVGCRVQGQTDAAGRFGPVPVLPGILGLQVSDARAGWRHVHPVSLVAEPRATVQALLSVEVVTGRVVFVARAGGLPLARRRIAVLDTSGVPLTWANLTDEAGGVTFALVPGDYTFALNPGDATEFALDSASRSGSVQWTLAGPLAERVLL